jgi:hypothetical protein
MGITAMKQAQAGALAWCFFDESGLSPIPPLQSGWSLQGVRTRTSRASTCWVACKSRFLDAASAPTAQLLFDDYLSSPKTKSFRLIEYLFNTSQ